MVKEADSHEGTVNTPQGQRQLFGLDDDCKSCLKHVTTRSNYHNKNKSKQGFNLSTKVAKDHELPLKVAED
eukprot:2260496-Ditylum_brightwellii.AAC.1